MAHPHYISKLVSASFSSISIRRKNEYGTGNYLQFHISHIRFPAITFYKILLGSEQLQINY